MNFWTFLLWIFIIFIGYKCFELLTYCICFVAACCKNKDTGALDKLLEHDDKSKSRKIKEGLVSQKDIKKGN